MIDQILQVLGKQGYYHTPQFLNAEKLSEINHFFDLKKDQFTEAMIGRAESKQRVTTVRGDYIFWMDPLQREEPFIEIYTFLEELKVNVNQNFYLGLQEYECHLAYYAPQNFYRKHLDRFGKENTRKLTFVFYLHQSWGVDDGGELFLYDKDNNLLEVILPTPGTFVCFMSDEFPHEVRAATKERRSFTGWMHTKLIY